MHASHSFVNSLQKSCECTVMFTSKAATTDIDQARLTVIYLGRLRHLYDSAVLAGAYTF